jgi:outer membrane protein assembly factor BamB
VTTDAFWTGAVKRWSVGLGGGISYPLIVGNQVFVTVADSGSYGSRLYALNANTGAVNWGPVELGGTYYWSGLTYDNGRIFTVNWSGMMNAFDANTGALQWAVQLQGNADVSSPPTSFGGLVYTAGAGVGGTVFAVDEATGAVVWTGSVMNGDNSSPAVSSNGVFVSYACGQTYDFAPSTGALNWHRSTGCEGGGGKTPVLANGRLYIRDFSDPAILDSNSGSLLGSFASSGPAPAVSSTTVYEQTSGTLSASGVTPGSPTAWSFTGDGTLSSAPLLGGADVFIAGTSGNVYALSAADGTVVWSANAGNGVPAPDEQNVAQPLTGLAESGGLLVVPAGSTLVAFR